MGKLKEIIKKVLTRETIMYIIFGILTTLVNIGISGILAKILKVEGNLASTIGIITSILFAYFTNRKWVFNSQARTMKEKWIEFLKFVFGRGFTMILEVVGVFVLYTVLGLEYMLTKISMTIIVVIINFFISKFFAFKNSKEK
ncbi:MAG: GtrA family protein [Clostridia bacterium]